MGECPVPGKRSLRARGGEGELVVRLRWTAQGRAL